jgi:hypothetical protein
VRAVGVLFLRGMRRASVLIHSVFFAAGACSCLLLCDAPLIPFGLLASRLEAMSVSRPHSIQLLQPNSFQLNSFRASGGSPGRGDVRPYVVLTPF